MTQKSSRTRDHLFSQSRKGELICSSSYVDKIDWKKCLFLVCFVYFFASLTEQIDLNMENVNLIKRKFLLKLPDDYFSVKTIITQTRYFNCNNKILIFKTITLFSYFVRDCTNLNKNLTKNKCSGFQSNLNFLNKSHPNKKGCVTPGT